MTVLSSAALALLQSQHGVASAQQLKDCGVSRHQIDSLVQSANLVPVLKGVYRHPVATFDELSRCVAFCVAHPSGVISGPTAGRLWGFRKLPNDRRIHAIVPPRAQPVSVKWIIPYRTAAIHDDDRIRRPDGIVVTSRQRTALDLARSIDSNLGLLSVIEQAAVDGGLDQKALRAVAVDWRSGQRPWLERYLRLVARRLGGGGADSHPEVLLGDRLVDAGVRGMVRQHNVDLPGYGPARFDLAVPHLKWAIEVDAFPTHQETAGRMADRRRDDAAITLGWCVTRVTVDDLVDIDGTVTSLQARYRSMCKAVS